MPEIARQRQRATTRSGASKRTLLPFGLWWLLLVACADQVHVRLLSAGEPADDSGNEPGTDEAATPEATAAPTATADAPSSTADAAAPSPTEPTAQPIPPEAGPPHPDAAPVAAPHPAVLRHHYDFAGEGAQVSDRIGSAHGIVIGGGELDGTGALTLDGVDDYVDLPNGIISRYPAVTVAVWLEWNGGNCWQRIFDFGNTPDGEDNATRARTSFLLSPGSCDTSHVGPVPVGAWNVSAMFHVRGSAYVLQGDAGLAVGERTHLVLSAAPQSGLVLYEDGELQSQLMAPLDVSTIEDENNWLGRSQWGHDDMLFARLFDFRIYEGALDTEQVAELYRTTGEE